MRDIQQCDACGCTDEAACQECKRQARIRKGHTRGQREEGGYDERDYI